LKYAVEREQKDLISYKRIHTPNIDVNGASFFPFNSPEYKGIDEEDGEGGSRTGGSPIRNNRTLESPADLALYFFYFFGINVC
jgi:hypothetical protein